MAYGTWIFSSMLCHFFCLSSNLNITHIVLLGYISVVYPICLIVLTLICVELHGHNFQPLVWLWRPFHKYFVRLRRGWDTKSDIIDVFATFFLLSYSKLMYQSFLLINCPFTLKADPESDKVSFVHSWAGINCGSTNYLKYAISSALILGLSSFLVLFLILYPVKCFRHCCCSRCGNNLQTAIFIFVEKFYGCYKDGLDSGWDMRSFSGLYFVLRILVCLSYGAHTFLSQWTFEAILFVAAAMLIALIRPYKKTYMNVLDALLLSLLAVLCLLLSSKYTSIQGIEVYAICFIPAFVFWLFFIFFLAFKLLKIMLTRRCSNPVTDNQQSELLNQPISTTVSEVHISSYGSM